MSEVTLNKSLDYLKNLKLGDLKYNAKIQKLFMQIYESKKLVSTIEEFADEYAFDKSQRECGFRSIVEIYLVAVTKAVSACEKPSFLWRLFYTKNRQINQLQVHCEILDNFITMFRNLLTVHERSNGTRNLISDEGIHENMIVQTLHDVNLSCFYGTEVGFYHASPSKLQSRFFIIAMTSFGDFYYSGKSLLIRLLNVPINMLKYAMDPILCGKKAEEIIRHADIDFMKVAMLFFTSKFSCFIQNFLHHGLAVNKIIKISPEPIKIQSLKDDRLIDIQMPSSHFKTLPIPCRLLSATKRRGMVGEDSQQEMSKYLILHAHGGGFYTHTSESHEIYLRSWAHHLDVPILSVEYSLTPEAPFPRAIEEIFYVYCWILKTGGKLLGSTAENIIFVGDSAGANLITAVLIKCIEAGIPLPKGILTVYGLFLTNYATIPSRMLGLCDIFLTYSMTLRIFMTYAGHFKGREPIRNGKVPTAPEDEFDDEIPKNHLLSPIWSPDEVLRQLPKFRMLTTNFDPLLDENIEMAKKLRARSVDVKLDIQHGIVHGFLHMTRAHKANFGGSMACVNHMKELLGIDCPEILI